MPRLALPVAAILTLLVVAHIPAADAEPGVGNTLPLPDGMLYYVSIGPRHGTPLVAISGGPGFDHSILASSPAWKRLARTRPVILYDQRGTGRSTSSQSIESIRVAGLVNDLETLRQHLGAPRFDLLGWSWGGFLALAYSVKFPEHVAHLVLTDSAPPKLADNVYLFEQVFPDILARQAPNLTAAGQVGCESERIEDYVRMEFYDPEKAAQFIAHARPIPFSERMCTALILDALTLDLSAPVRTLAVPTLVATGRFDMNVAPVVAFKLSKAIPGAQFQLFERSGHAPFHEQPLQFADVVARFLDTPAK